MSESTTPATAGFRPAVCFIVDPVTGYIHPWHAAAGAGGTLLLVPVTGVLFCGGLC